MAGEKRSLYINGEWVAPKNKAEFPVYNPANGEVWTSVADAGRSEARSAIAAAKEAQPAWAAMPHSQRARLLSKAGDILERRQNEFQEALVV
jgi:acyl-CoA reductase-like NAD-dependent aldehyde dehydrogenase